MSNEANSYDFKIVVVLVAAVVLVAGIIGYVKIDSNTKEAKINAQTEIEKTKIEIEKTKIEQEAKNRRLDEIIPWGKNRD